MDSRRSFLRVLAGAAAAMALPALPAPAATMASGGADLLTEADIAVMMAQFWNTCTVAPTRMYVSSNMLLPAGRVRRGRRRGNKRRVRGKKPNGPGFASSIAGLQTNQPTKPTDQS